MPEPLLSKEGQEILGTVLTHRAPIIRQELKQKVLRILSLLMNEQGVKEAGRDLVIEAADMVLGKAAGLFLRKMRKPDEYQQRLFDRYYSMEDYYTGPYFVRRWDSIPSKLTKSPDEMKVIAFCASPRKGGNTDILVDEALRGAEDAGAKVELIRLQKLNIKPCIGCKKCKQPGFEHICAQKDDMSDIYQKIIDSGAIIIGFPIYGWRECAQLAIFIDRLFCLSRARTDVKSSNTVMRKSGDKKFEREMLMYTNLLEPGRRALVIGVWGTPYVDTYDEVIERIISLLSESNIESVEAISACGFVGVLHGLDERRKGVIARFPKELEKAYQAGKTLVTGER